MPTMSHHHVQEHPHAKHSGYHALPPQPDLEPSATERPPTLVSDPALEAEPLARSRVAPEVNPAGGGIVADSQQADTEPGGGPALNSHVPFKERMEAKAEILVGKITNNEEKVADGEATLAGEKL